MLHCRTEYFAVKQRKLLSHYETERKLGVAERIDVAVLVYRAPITK